MKQLTLYSASFFLFTFLLVSCDLFDKKKDDPGSVPNLDNIVTGSSTEVANSPVGLAGANIKISKPDTPVDGMEITIPANSFSSVQTVTVSYSEIKSHKFGQFFNPISPMITIACDGGYSNEIMSVTIPVKVPEGQIAIGFFLDEATGKLEGIPFESITSNSITLLTRHFLSGNMLRSGDVSLKSTSAEANKGANIIISSISESVLNLQPVIASGFKPGVDDWEFVNFGSYISSGGHCAGQTLAAMWYYFEKKLKGEGDLFGKFSTVASLWQDNAIGYRFCSVIQEDYQIDGEVFTFFDKYIDKNQELDKLKYYMIAGAMLVTGEPQGIAIFLQTGTNAKGKPIWDGHAVICYQVAINEGKLYISDPNKPGIEQFIEFKNNKFEPYIAKLNGNAASNPYPFVTWYAKTAYIEWDKIGKRYTELLDSTIGNKAPNTFPPYTIWVKGKADSQLKDGFSINSDTLRCIVECPAASKYWIEDGKKRINYDFYDSKGLKTTNYEGRGKAYILLKPGLNKVGLYVYSKKDGVTDADGNLSELFIDFKWFNITYSKLFIDPNPILGKPDEEIKITAISGGTAPKNAKYVWNFGDGSPEATVINDSTVNHTFAKEGEFEVTVALFDNSTNNLISKASAKATIAIVKDDLANLQKCRYIDLEFCPRFGDAPTGTNFNLTPNYYNAPVPFRLDVVTKWENTSFTLDYKGKTPDGYNFYFIFSGNMSSDAKEILTLTLEKWIYGFGLNAKVVFKNIPFIRFEDESFWKNYKNDRAYLYSLTSESTLSHVTESYNSGYNEVWNKDGNLITDPGMWGIKLYFWDYDEK